MDTETTTDLTPGLHNTTQDGQNGPVAAPPRVISGGTTEFYTPAV